MPFKDDLVRYGPNAEFLLTINEAKAYCSHLTASSYENFSVVTWLTPKKLRPAFASIYAFCRWSDDLGDEVGNPAQSIELLAWWRDELRKMYAGETRHPVFQALAPTITEFAIPIDPFEALISAFEQDQIVTEYETFPQLLDYCTRSANPVGHLVLYLARVFNKENARLSDCTCSGLQLANFWQDIARDLDIPRIYIPREDRILFGYSDHDLQSRRFTPSFREMLAYEVGRSRAMLMEGRDLVPKIPGQLSVDIDLFTRGGLAILDRIHAQGYDVWKSRPKVSRLAKVRLLLHALLTRPRKEACS